RREMAVRTALGATRGRLVAQLLSESLVLAILGGGLGLVIAVWGIDLLTAFAPAELPRLNRFRLDWRVLLLTIGVCVGARLLFLVTQALSAAKTDAQEAMKEGGAAFGGARRHRLLGGLVVGELALALVLLGGAGLLLRSLWNVGAVDPGFAARGVLSSALWLPQPNKLEDGKYFKFEQREGFYPQLLQKRGSGPGVETAALVSSVPLRGDRTRSQAGILPEGREEGADTVQIVQFRFASNDYFRTMRIPFLDGRGFADTDLQKAPQVAVINATLAHDFWPGQSAVGKRFRFPGAGPGGGGGGGN